MGRMWEAFVLVVLVAASFLWLDSLRARERAVRAGRAACERYGLQLLDDTVAFARMRFARNDMGELRIARTYTFEFSDTGNNRRQGAIVLVGAEVEDLRLEPYPVQ